MCVQACIGFLKPAKVLLKVLVFIWLIIDELGSAKMHAVYFSLYSYAGVGCVCVGGCSPSEWVDGQP